LEPFAHVDLHVREGRSLDIFTSVVSKDLFGKRFMDDYARYTAAEVMVEIADKLVAEEAVPALQHFLLLVGALRALGDGTTDGERPAAMILDSYILRAASLAGYAPQLDSCAGCGAQGPHSFFDSSAGGVVCLRCRTGGAGAISPATLTYVVALLTGDWVATRDVAVVRIAEGSSVVRAFLNWHLERGIRSLAHVEPEKCERLHTQM